MNEQLKHDTAVAAAHAAVGCCPGCLVTEHPAETFQGIVQLFRATLDAYDHFREEESRAAPSAGYTPPEFEGYGEPM